MSLDELKVIDVSNIITVRHDPEIWPNKGAMTLRGLCAQSPENKDLLEKLQAVVDANHLVCDESLFDDEFKVITDMEEVKKLLTEVIIRFDTKPEYYTKEDYQLLISLLYRSLFYLHSKSYDIPYLHEGPGIQLEGPVDNITISSTVEEDITVAGVTVGNISSGDVVQKGRDLTEVLKQMLVKEIDVKAVAPSVIMSPSGIQTYEYGTRVKIGSITVSLSQGKFISSDTTVWNPDPVLMDCAITSAQVWNTYGDVNNNTAVISIPDVVLTQHTEIAPIVKVSPNTVQAYTNLNNASSETYLGGNLVPADTIELHPYYLLFHGNYQGLDLNSITGEEIRQLKSEQVLFGTDSVNINSEYSTNGGSLVIACPSKYNLAGVQYSLGAPILDNFLYSKKVNVQCGEKQVEYTVYMYPIPTGVVIEYKNLKFTANGQA